MLIELRVRDFAVIEDARVELGPGLTVLTGETGAGKSLLVDALALLLGGRAWSEAVRAGAGRARIEAVFDVSGMPKLSGRLEELGIEAENGLLILSRQVAREGKNRAWVNGSPATASTVGELGRGLADLHSQHEHQTLLRKAEQRAILDALAGAGDLADRVASRFAERQGLKRQREERLARSREVASRADFLRFQRDEIDAAELVPGEENALEARSALLENAEELARETGAAYGALYDQEGAVADRIAAVRATLERLRDLDQGLSPLLDGLNEAYHQVTDVARALGAYADRVEHDPESLLRIRERLDLIARLKRKYGGSVAEILAARDEFDAELREVDDFESDLEDLDRRLAELGEAFDRECRALTRARSEAARRLSKEVQHVLPALGLPAAVFQIRLDRLDEPGSGGAEEVEFRASLNAGFEPRALSKIASGGELSRVMLALKSVLARVDPVPTLVFDEVDAGVGGTIAVAVADRLAALAETHQVLVVTHLAQVASRAARHLEVVKETEAALATASVRGLEGEEQVREIARMLGGDPDSARSRDHARELLAID